MWAILISKLSLWVAGGEVICDFAEGQCAEAQKNKVSMGFSRPLVFAMGEIERYFKPWIKHTLNHSLKSQKWF